MPKRIIMLTQWFDPEPAYRGAEFAIDLVSQGYEVEVVTGFPNYPGGQIYDGYKISPIQKRAVREGFSLTRLALYPSHDRSKIGRILNYLSFFVSAFIYLAFFAKRADLVYVYHPPLTVGLSAAFAKFVRRWPVVLEIQDLWPDTLEATGMIGNKRVLAIVGWWAQWLYRRVDHIIVQSWGFRDRITQRGEKEQKVSVIINWANETDQNTSSFSSPFNSDHKFRVLFAGNMGPAQKLSSVLAAAEKLAHSHSEIGFYFLGSGLEAEALKEYAADRSLDNVVFLPRVSASEVGPFLEKSDALLVHLADDPLFSITIPSKTQAYLNAGKPIIMGVRGDAARLVEESGGGLVVPPSDCDALAAAVEKMAAMSHRERDEMGKRAKDFYDEQLCKEKGFASFVGVFEDVMSKRLVNKA